MTREEAILLSAYTGFLLVQNFSDVHKFCEDTLGRPIWTHEFADRCVQKEIQAKLRPQIMELVQNISALRPVSREQVEKVWMGCKYCDEEWGTCNPITNRFVMPPRGGIQYCPMCGKPLTDEAVEMVMERMEEMKNG